QPGDLLELDGALRRGQRKNILFVLPGRSGVPGGKKFSRLVIQPGDNSSCGRTIHVNIPDSEKDADASAGPARVFFIGNDHHASIGRRNNYPRIGGDFALWVTKKRKTEKAKGDQHACKNPPVQNNGYSAKQQRW